jgi:WD40 repeat protein
MKRAQQVCSAFVDPDVPAPLREFLSQALPLIESALQCNSASTAFESYYAQHTLKHETAQLTRTLTVDFVKAGLLQQLSASSILQCTGVSWNATGTTLAVSYGRVDVPGWCDLPGAVCLWNLIGRKFRADRPDIILDHSSCVMCVAWHPLRPAVVAAGCFSGEVVVWDTSLEPETLVACSRIQESYHMTPVMQVRWILDPHAKEILLASIAGDGKVLFWSQRDSFQCPRRYVWTLHCIHYCSSR